MPPRILPQRTNKSKLDRVQNMGLRIILGAMRTTSIQQMEKIANLQSLECRCKYKAAIQGKKLKRLTSHHSTRNFSMEKKTPEKKELQAQAEGAAKRKCWSSRGRSRKIWGTHECLGIAEEPSRNQNWNSRPSRKGNTGSATAESAHTGDDAGSLSQEHLDPCLHRWLCRERS